MQETERGDVAVDTTRLEDGQHFQGEGPYIRVRSQNKLRELPLAELKAVYAEDRSTLVLSRLVRDKPGGEYRPATEEELAQIETIEAEQRV